MSTSTVRNMDGKSEQVGLNLHVGRAILQLANEYPSLISIMLEQVQNALDGNANKIEIVFDRMSNHYTVSDNGDGASREHFHKALCSVGQGIKERTKLGQFGLGLISPLGKCDWFTFTSCPKPQMQGYNSWLFSTEKIQKQKESATIPMTQKKALRHVSYKGRIGSTKSRVWWRTQVDVHDVTTDRMISRFSLDSLEEGIVTNFSAAMKRCGTTVTVIYIDPNGEEFERKIRAKEFSGRRLPEIRLHSEDSGETIIRLYLTRPLQRSDRGRINIRFGTTENDFRFSFANFARSLGGSLLSDEVINAFKTRIFEGEILSEKVRLNVNRTCFEKDDALMGFCISIEKWFNEHGKQYLDEQRQERSDLRYQDLGLKSMETLKRLLSLPDSEALKGVFSHFKKGTIGSGHTIHRGKPQEETAISVDGGQTKEIKDEEPRTRPEFPEEEKKGHNPFTVTGPKGKRRRTVKSNSLGLQLAYDELGGDSASKLWVLDCETGILTFNITHPLWVDCDDSDAKICALQEYIVIQALTLETMPDPVWREHQGLYVDEAVKHFVSWLQTGVRFSRVKTKK